ncbi:MAG: hypothetical protein ACOY3E_17905 [Pseudomonadota bacterium]
MDEPETEIRDRALLRLAGIFRVPVSALKPELRFGIDLKASFVSDFRRNELDRVSDDIHDVADRAVTKEFESGRLVISTVSDYCDHMVRCSKVKPENVKILFEADEQKRQRSAGSI